jgi:hypothetical protein
MSIADGSEQVVDLPPLSPYADLDEIRLHLIRMQQWLRAREPIAAGSVLTKFVTNGALVARGLLEFSGETEGGGNAGFSPDGGLTAAAGIAGADAPIVVITSTGQIFVDPADGGSITPASVTLTATTANVPGPTYEWLVDGVVDGASITNTYTLNSFAPGPAKIIRVNVTGSNAVTVFDLMSIYSLQEGASAIAAGLDNENQTVQCDSGGTPVAGSFPVTSTMVVARGSVFLAAPDVTFSVVESTGIESAGTTVGASANVSITSAGAITIGQITSGYAEAIFRATVGAFTIDKKLTLNKSINGADGSTAQTLVLTSTGFAFVFADANATAPTAPSQIDFTAALQNVTGAASWAAMAYDAAGTSLGAVALTDTSAALDLDFSSATLDPRIAFARSSTATYFDAAGVMQTAAVNAPRIDHDPSTHAVLGLLIEEQRTNLLTYSGDLRTGANWQSGATLANFFAASLDSGMAGPDGTMGVAKFVTGASTSQGLFLRKGSLTLTAGTYSAATYIYVPTQTGVTSWTLRNDYADAEFVTAGAQTVFDRWVRVSTVVTLAATRSFVDYNILRNGVVPTNGDGFTFYAACPQLEVGAFPTSYIPTTTAAVTRSADSAVLTGANFSSWYNQTEGTFAVEAIRPTNIPSGAYPRIIYVGDGGNANRYNIHATDISGVDRLYVSGLVGGASQWDIASGSAAFNLTPGAVARFALGYAANDVAAAINGTLGTVDTSASLPTVDRLEIGGDSTTCWNGTIRRITYYNTRKPNADLQALSSGSGISNVRTLTGDNFVARANTRTVKVTATLGALSDTMTVYRGDNGASAIQSRLTNEVHAVPTAADGTGAVYTGSGTTIEVYEGTTELNYDPAWTSANGGWKVTAAVTTGTIAVGAISESGSKAVVADHAGLATDVATITYTVTGKSATGASFSLPIVQTITRSKQGVSGAPVYVEYSIDGSTLWHSTFAAGDLFARWKVGVAGAWSEVFRIVGETGSGGDYVEFIFKRSAAQPATPTGDTPAGWFDAPPAADGNPLWSSKGTKSAAGVLQGAWSTPVQIEGEPGADGVDAQTLTLSATGFAFIGADAAATAVTGPDLSFTANLQNVSGTATFVATAYNAAGTSLGTIAMGGSGNTRTLTPAQFTNSGAWATWRVGVTATLGALSDTMTVYRGNDGTDTVQVVLSNEAHTLATTAAGVVTYTGSGTLVRVFEGTTELQAVVASPGNGQWTVTSAPTNIGVGGGAITGLYITVGDHYGMTADQAKIDYTITGKTLSGAAFEHLVTQSFAKSKAGNNGKGITVKSDGGAVFMSNAAGTGYTPASIILSRDLHNVSDPSAAGTVWSLVAGTCTQGLTVINSSTGAFASLQAGELTTDSVTFRCTVTDSVTGETFTDDITIWKSRDPISGYLTNDSISLPAAAGGGAVSSYTGATGTFKITNASGDITVSGGNPSFAYVSSTGFSTAPSASINSSGIYTISSGIDPSTAVQVATVTYRATYVDPLGGVTKTIDRTFTLTKAPVGTTGDTGSPGAQGANARRSYALFTISAFTAVTWDAGTTLTVAGDALPGASTVSNPNAATTWTSATQTPAAGQAMYQADGVYNPATGQTVWNEPYLSNFRVGSLSALSADLGTITAGTITGALVRTAASGARIVLNESTSNTIRGYTSTGLLTFEADADNGRTRITGNSAIFGALFVTQQSSAAAVEGSGNSGPGVWGYSTSGPGGRFSSLRIDQTPSTGAATATFAAANKPGAATTNSWITINLNGTTHYVPVWT